jgi:hypothetical protein
VNQVQDKVQVYKQKDKKFGKFFHNAMKEIKDRKDNYK